MKKSKSKMVDIDSIRPRPEGQMRFETLTDEAIKTKAESMKAVAQLQPILVDKDNFIIGGEIRWCAGKLLGWKEIEVQVVTYDSEFERMSIQLAENEQTTPPSSFELAAMYGRMHEEFLKTWEKPAGHRGPHTKGITAMANALGMHSGELMKHIQLNSDNRITPELRVLSQRVRINSNVILQIAHLPANIAAVIIQRSIDVLDEGGGVPTGSGLWSSGLLPLLRHKPELVEVGLDVALGAGTGVDKLVRLKAMLKDEKTEAEKEQDGLNSVLRASNTLEKALSYWNDDASNVPASCRDVVLTKWGRLYKRFDAFFAGADELTIGGE